MSFILGLLTGKMVLLSVRKAPGLNGSLTSQPAENGPIPELLTILEVGRLLKISPYGVRRLQQGRHIPFFKVGGSVRFAKSDIIAYLGRNRVVPPTQ